MNRPRRVTLTLLSLLLSVSVVNANPNQVYTQEINRVDTLGITLEQFIAIGLEASGQIEYERRMIDLAENRVQQMRANRILPNFSLQTQHGLVPGVNSDSVRLDGTYLPEGQLYLDPYLKNDWTDWALFTRAQIDAIQPLFTWGATKKAIQAAESAAEASLFEFESKKTGTELALTRIYYSYLLTGELERIVEDAESSIRQVEEQLRKLQEEGSEELTEADLFKFEIFKEEFQIQRVEVTSARGQMNRLWEYITRRSPQPVRPVSLFLDPVPTRLESFTFYHRRALELRPEIKGVEAGAEALRQVMDVAKTESYPMFFLGLSASYAVTPNRPKQDNPFIINSTNYATARFGVGIRQNLNFLATESRVEKSRIEYRRVQDLRSALEDAVMIELSEAYKNAEVEQTRLEQTERALVATKNWVRHEQLNYDYGFGDVKELINSLQKQFELEAELSQSRFDWNTRLAELYKASGIPLSQLSGIP